MRSLVSYVALSVFALSTVTLSAQNSTVVVVEPTHDRPVYRVEVVARTVESVNYRHRASTKIDFRGTKLMPEAHGRAKIASKAGRMEIRADFSDLRDPNQFGPEYLTYVLWAVTPEGRPVNLGEIVPDSNANAHTQVTVNLQNFGLIVTAEPYFAVTRPSDMTVVENILRKDTRGWEQPISARYEATEKGEYTIDLANTQLPTAILSHEEIKATPLSLIEARNAVAIAGATGAPQYAPAVFVRAEDMLHRAEAYYEDGRAPAAIATAARGATEAAEDARVLTIRKKADERIALERKAAEERTQAARREAEEQRRAAALQQQQAQSAREAQQQAELSAKQAQMEAQQSAEQAVQERAAAEQSKAEALKAQQQAEASRLAAKQQQDALAAQAEAARQQAEAARQQALTAEQRAQAAEQEKEQVRQRLRAQLNEVMQTRDTARGLIVNMNDVLFDFNKATLKPGAKVRLAKIAGILQAYPDLKLQLEGYTDSIGSPDYNQGLSEKRADAVRDFLVSQGVSPSSIAAQGFGEANPVATNNTAEGRQLNRRVDLVVSGESISAHTEQRPAVDANTGPGAMSEPAGQQQALPPDTTQENDQQ